MTLPAHGSQDRLISAVAAVNQNTVVINNTGNPIDMPWFNNVAAVLQAWFPGQEAGNSIVDVLFGKVNPAGRLPMTWPRSLQQTPAYKNFPGDVDKLVVNYEEGVEIGYRFYDRHTESELFPFGYGLSYSKFKIMGDSLQLSAKTLARGEKLTVIVEVKNLGPLSGSEVVQVYVAPPKGSKDRPLKALAGFAKVTLEVDEVKMAAAQVDFDALAYWHEEAKCWAVDKGLYKVEIGTSARDIVASQEISVDEDVKYAP
jgi:beta-glucosidase